MFKGISKNVWVLFTTQIFMLSAIPVSVMLGGIVGAKMAPIPKFATLPASFLIIGTALFTIPAALSMKRFGRKKGTYFGIVCALAGVLVSMTAIIFDMFWLLIWGFTLVGMSTAYIQQMRFAVIESTKISSDVPRALAVLLMAGVFASLIGPEIAVMAEHLLPVQYAGSFLVLAVVIVIALIVFSKFENPETEATDQPKNSRSVVEIIRQPVFIAAVCASGLGYGVMSFIMTATPISMHELDNFSLSDTKFVIQSHLMAMFLPSLLAGYLIGKFGIPALIALGTALYGVSIWVGVGGHEMGHYWWSLVALGIGWNFLFLGGTSLLPEAFKGGDRHKVQAINDFTVFMIQALAAMSSGWVLFEMGWTNLLMFPIPILLVLLMVSGYLFRSPKSL